MFIFGELQISRVILSKRLSFLDISRAQHDTKIPKNNSQGIIFVRILCQRVDEECLELECVSMSAAITRNIWIFVPVRLRRPQRDRTLCSRWQSLAWVERPSYLADGVMQREEGCYFQLDSSAAGFPSDGVAPHASCFLLSFCQRRVWTIWHFLVYLVSLVPLHVNLLSSSSSKSEMIQTDDCA